MIMTVSSVLVLAAMTVTGVYIYNSNQTTEPENNVVDFSALENSAQENSGQLAQVENNSAQNLTSGQENSGELDYDPYYAEQDRILNEEQGSQDMQQAEAAGNESGGGSKTPAEGGSERSVGYAEISNQGQSGQAETDSSGESEDGQSSAAGNMDDAAQQEANNMEADGQEEAALNEDAVGEEPALEAVADVVQEAENLHFSENSRLEWPIAGNVLLNYSMDKTIYFQTLQQYKYNPSIVISATQGTNVACAADGIVKSIYKDQQTGTTVVMSLGDGYELAYGQLQDVTVEEGDFVETGAFIGKVAAPTKYYTVEGTNVYFKMTKDSEPVNPMNYLG